MRLLGTLAKDISEDLEAILVDDASTDGTFEKVKSAFPEVQIVRTNNEVFLAEARNLGARCAKANHVLFVDDDIVMRNNAIQTISKFLENHPTYGIAGPVITYLWNERVIWHTGVIYTAYNLNESRYIRNHDTLDSVKRTGSLDCSYVPGAFMMAKETFRQLRGFDSENFPFSYEDLDISLRVKNAGLRVACVLPALALHDIDEPHTIRSIGSVRAFHHGRSRTRFYIKYCRWKLLWLPIYFSGFIVKQVPNGGTGFRKFAHVVASYLEGVVCGLAQK